LFGQQEFLVVGLWSQARAGGRCELLERTVIHENQIEFLDETWRAPSRRAKARSGVPMMLATAYVATRPSGGTGQRRAKLERLAKKAPEAMVKVTGRQRGGAHTLAHLDYIARHGKLEVETSDAEMLRGKERLEEIAAEWSLREDGTTKRRDPLTSVSMILSMPPGSDPEIVRNAARAFARVEMERFPYVMALHTDTDHPHVHLTVAARGEGGERFNPRKDDLARYRETFARELQARGMEAEATPRRARGIVQKRETMPVRKMRDRADSGQGETPRVLQAARRTTEAMMGESPPGYRAWEEQTFVRQAKVRTAYAAAADQLAASSSPADRALAATTRAFLKEMPEPATRDREAHLAAHRARTADPAKAVEPLRLPPSRDDLGR